MTATEVIRRRNALSERLRANNAWHALLRGHLEHESGSKGFTPAPETAELIVNATINAITTEAANYLVRADVVDVVERHMRELPEDGGYTLGELAVPDEDAGFAWLERGVYVPDPGGHLSRFDIVTWTMRTLIDEDTGVERPGVLVCWWAHEDRDRAEGYTDRYWRAVEQSRVEEPERIETFLRVSHGWRVVAFTAMDMDGRIGPQFADLSDNGLLRELVENHVAAGADPDRIEMPNLRRWLGALWGVLSGVLPGVEHSPESAISQRTAKTARRRGAPTSVSVTRVAVRTTRSGGGEGTGTPLQYRKPIRSHYRTIHRGEPNERRVKIIGYVQGADLPERPPRPAVRVAGRAAPHRREDTAS